MDSYIGYTSVVMKCFEKIIVNMLKVAVVPSLDPLQFTYRQGQSTEDGVCPAMYLDEIDTFKDSHHQILNIKIIFDPREVRVDNPVIITDNVIEQMSTFKYVGIQLDCNLTWGAHVYFLCGQLAQRLHLLRRLRLFGVSSDIISIIYAAVIESIIRFGMIAWLGTQSS